MNVLRKIYLYGRSRVKSVVRKTSRDRRRSLRLCHWCLILLRLRQRPQVVCMKLRNAVDLIQIRLLRLYWYQNIPVFKNIA